MKQANIQYLGHSTVLIQSENQKTIIIDPFLEGNPLCPKNLLSPNVDYILLSHGHADHASSAAPLAKRTGATIFATFELAMLMTQEGVPQKQVQPMNKGGTVKTEDGLSISLTDAKHSSSFNTSDGKIHYAGEAAGIVLGLESGRNIYHAGDTLLFSDMKLIAEKFSPEIALLPIGDCFTMGPADAAKATKLISPKFVIPIHHSTFPQLSGTPREFEKQVADFTTKVIALAPGQDFSF